MNIKLIQSTDRDQFQKLCNEAVEKGYMFVGQVVITGLGQGKFMYTQQWAKGAEDEVQPDKSED